MNMKNRILILVSLSLSLACGLNAQNASAFSLGAMGAFSSFGGGFSTASSTSGLTYGVEATFGTLYDVGVFYEKTGLDGYFSAAGTSVKSDNNFMGALGRFYLGDIFVDGKMGISYVDGYSGTLNGQPLSIPSSSKTFAYGIGVGYKYKLIPMFAIMPRLGYRSFNSGSASTIDVGVVCALMF